MMNSDLADKLIEVIKNCIRFSLQFDESVDGADISQRCIFKAKKDISDDPKKEIIDFVQSIPGFQECDAEDCEFKILNDDEIATSVQEESDPVDDKTDENEDNESSKGPLNADAFSALETAMECDEAHFWLNGYVNKQNCRIWSEANPQVYVETPLHPEKLTVWCALWAGGIIGPYFFKNDEGHNVTVNGAVVPTRRRNMSHSSCATIDLLKDTFGDRLISRFGPVNWPPRSCDLTPLDYFLWGYVKSLVYADKPQTLDHLEDNIRRVIADIRPQMLEKVIENWTSRLDYIRASRGSPMPEIIFKM
ncbi:uncharacterized protein TNCV_4681941 [Trichonephila clavipes]|nr:uncharacterized protein TNCV_4681941 [Trichonephila clavipes]